MCSVRCFPLVKLFCQICIHFCSVVLSRSKTPVECWRKSFESSSTELLLHYITHPLFWAEDLQAFREHLFCMFYRTRAKQDFSRIVLLYIVFVSQETARNKLVWGRMEGEDTREGRDVANEPWNGGSVRERKPSLLAVGTSYNFWRRKEKLKAIPASNNGGGRGEASAKSEDWLAGACSPLLDGLVWQLRFSVWLLLAMRGEATR